jgi:uncharacterized protein (TIGR02117 family)
MSTLKKILRGTLYTISAFIIFVLLYLGITYLLFFLPVNKNAAQQGPDELSIYIMTNGVHTDIVVPVKHEIMDWSKITRFEDTESKDTTFRYVAFGWGDKGFYLETPQWSDLKFSTAVKAMFHLGSTAMHIDFCRTMIPGEKCKEIRISKAQYQKLVNYLKDSFQYDANGKPIQIITHNDGYGTDDVFYEAKGAYDLFNTCNTWANSALKSCDQKACWWTPTDKGIFHQYAE